jgi:hypothetical protein
LSGEWVATWTRAGHDLGMPGEVWAGADQPPTHEALVADLRRVRGEGLTKLRRLRLDALHQAARLCDLSDGLDPQPAAVEALLRQAVEAIGGGQLGDAAAYTLGLAQGTKGWPAQDRRREAARAFGVGTDRYRKFQEKIVIEQVAEQILGFCREHRMRRARMHMEQRLPAESRLAVQWVERFEAYYRIWTPVGHIADDLKAAALTRREPDPEHAPWDPDASWNGAEDQAMGYARFALFAYAQYTLELKKFVVRHGGLWLLSSMETENQVADAIYRIGWHNPLNEEDDSWLRRALSQAQGEEQVHFRHLLLNSSVGSSIHQQWQEYVASCACPNDEEIEETCQVHATIRACQDYCRLIDEDWDLIADWYHAGEQRRPRVDGETLYRRMISHVET